MNRTTLLTLLSILILPCQAMALTQTKQDPPPTRVEAALSFKVCDLAETDVAETSGWAHGSALSVRWVDLMKGPVWMSKATPMAEQGLQLMLFSSRQIAVALNPQASGDLMLMGMRGSNSKYNSEIFAPATLHDESISAVDGLMVVWQQTMLR